MKTFFLLLLTASLFCTGCYQKTDDETAIKTLLEKESASWRSGDIKAHADCWHLRPYSRILFSNGQGLTVDVPASLMIHPKPTQVGHGGSSTNSNYHFSIYKTNAWVSHHETSTAADGKKSYTYEMRMLEKVNGEWKLVGQSIHQYELK